MELELSKKRNYFSYFKALDKKNWFSKQEMELFKQEMELISSGQKNSFKKCFYFSKEFKIEF